MGGKASLLVVLGFTIIMMISGRNFNSMAVNTTENMTTYYLNTKVHHMAVSGINLVVNRLFLDASIPDKDYNFDFDGGTIKVELKTLDAYQNIKQLLSTGTYDNTSNTVKVILKPSMFSKFAYFSNNENGVWFTVGDTIFGPMHTNDNINIAYHPVFMGKVTIGKSENKYNSGSSGVYLGGFQKNIQIAIPSSGVSNVAAAAPVSPGGAQFTSNSLIYFDFRGDSVRYRFSTKGAWTYKKASTFIPNGIIYCDNAEVHIKGNVKGKYTIAASGSSGDKGNIYLDDDIYYNTDPQTNPNSQDMLGIVAQRNVIITDNTANNTGGIKIQAAIYAQSGSFTAENYDSRPLAGNINLLGGITQNTRGAVSTFSGSSLSSGFSKRYHYDQRLLVSYPPAYPGCGSFEIVSWFE